MEGPNSLDEETKSQTGDITSLVVVTELELCVSWPMLSVLCGQFRI